MIERENISSIRNKRTFIISFDLQEKKTKQTTKVPAKARQKKKKYREQQGYPSLFSCLACSHLYHNDWIIIMKKLKAR